MKHHTLKSIAALAVTVLAFGLAAGCHNDSGALPAPHEITDSTVSVLDGMSLKEYPGPKAQMLYADGHADFFCDTLGLFSVYLRPEHDRKVSAMYVQDMGAADWLHPEGHWIDATQATYVVGSKKAGAMGQTFVSFAKESDAEQFVKSEGGKLYHFNQITSDMATTDGGVVKDQNM
ncbi:nitrous oxide reductase accessory protein NosL [Paraburkholderia dinghuensis]|uniref:Nitrous oxide reductase accessory protein NosL n=1 Tax=Paraburkholderia dinghuensis TaxID=2305225 RepID=A0A3N6N065_9BURK|nr:nitrous oxide reductase accessory protein NosL [Paraburkholderia dinghuensis]